LTAGRRSIGGNSKVSWVIRYAAQTHSCLTVDLLAPNLNREKVTYKAQLEREAVKKSAQDRKDRDRAALEKQRSAKMLGDLRYADHPKGGSGES
jgi:hypothetical protein